MSLMHVVRTEASLHGRHHLPLEIANHRFFQALVSEGGADVFSQLSRHDRTQIVAKNEIARLIRDWAPDGKALLDVGAGGGHPTVIYRDQFTEPTRTVIYDWKDVRYAEVREDVEFAKVDLEVDRFPDDDGTFDVVVCNQVFEHLKNIFTPISEMVRVLRTGGMLIISVPNLAALHNRAVLMFGGQPTPIQIGGSHVRGLSMRPMTTWLEHNGHLRLVRLIPVGLAPLIVRPLPRYLRGCCHTPIWMFQKQESSLPTWDDIRRQDFSSTNFFPDDPAMQHTPYRPDLA